MISILHINFLYHSLLVINNIAGWNSKKQKKNNHTALLFLKVTIV